MANKLIRYVTDSYGNMFYMEDMIKIFRYSDSHISKILKQEKIRTLKQLNIRLNRPRIIPKNTVFIPDKDGNVYRYCQLERMFGKSHTFLRRCYFQHGCRTLEDFQKRVDLDLNNHKEKSKKDKDRKNIESILMGSWEDRNVECPPANKKTPRSVRRDIHREESGGKHSKARWNDAYWKKHSRKSATNSEMKEALYLLEDNPILTETILKDE